VGSARADELADGVSRFPRGADLEPVVQDACVKPLGRTWSSPASFLAPPLWGFLCFCGSTPWLRHGLTLGRPVGPISNNDKAAAGEM